MSKHCEVNKVSAPGVLSLGLRLCSASVVSVLGEQNMKSLESWLGKLESGLEGDIVYSAVKGDFVQVIKLLPRIFPEAG